MIHRATLIYHGKVKRNFKDRDIYSLSLDLCSTMLGLDGDYVEIEINDRYISIGDERDIGKIRDIVELRLMDDEAGLTPVDFEINHLFEL